MPIDEELLRLASLRVSGADVHQLGVIAPDYKCSMRLSEDPDVEEDGPRGRGHWAMHCRFIEGRLLRFLATGDGQWLRWGEKEEWGTKEEAT